MFTPQPPNVHAHNVPSSAALVLSLVSESRNETRSSSHESLISLYSVMATLGADQRSAAMLAHSFDAADASVGKDSIIPFTGKTIPGLGQ